MISRISRLSAVIVIAAAGLGLGLATSGAGAGASSRTKTITLQGNSYTPKAANGGTDDYHCTLVNPHVTSNSYIVGSQFTPGSVEVHHAILFEIPPNLAAAATAADKGGKGWTCFGESPIPGTGDEDIISNTPWLAAWAPGVGKYTEPSGTGVWFPAGSMVVMQIHYNLLRGDKPVRAKLALTTVPGTTKLKPLSLDLLPAPPDIPCPAGVTGPLCNRAASLTDLSQRFGHHAVSFVNLIERVCGRDPNNPPAGNSTSCTWPIEPNREIVKLGAHMHLLGHTFSIVLDQGTSHAQTLLTVPNYNFDYQRSYSLSHPVITHPGDTVTVTCSYSPTLRQELPQLRKLPPRFITWGDGSSDEMCLGLVSTIAAPGTSGSSGSSGSSGTSGSSGIHSATAS